MERSRRNVTRPGRGASGGSTYRGEEGMARVEREIERQKQASDARKSRRNEPFRFKVPVGETHQLIICDDKPDFFRYEHNLKGADGKFGLITSCVKENDNCPACEVSGKESYYAMYLTCVDLTPFKTKAGEKVEFSRKLLVVKPAQQKKIIRLYRKEKSLRGMILDMTRDGEMSPSIGNDIEFVDFADEKEMATYTRSWKDKEGKKHTENCDEPFDYEKLFPEQTAEELRAIVGGKPTPGSKDSDREELEGRRGRPKRRSEEGDDADGWDKEEDDAPWDDKEEERPRRGAARRAKDVEEEEESPRRARRAKDEEVEEETPRRGRRGKSEEAEEEEAPRRSRRSRPVEDDPEEQVEEVDDPDVEEEDAPRGRRIQPRRAGRREEAVEEDAPRRARRSRVPEAEEEVEEEPPRRGRRGR
jgi:hypothetical protein